VYVYPIAIDSKPLTSYCSGILYTPVSKSGHKSLNVHFRKDLDIYASMTSIRNFPGKFPTRHSGVDIALIRENTEGEYSGLEHTVYIFKLQHL
jgi:isocitrate dehydrogenase (NAD+)